MAFRNDLNDLNGWNVLNMFLNSVLRTTMICTHVLNRGGKGVFSPVDRL
jgi:hypothetical protein